MTLRGKTLFVSGGSRGIGLAIALRAARDGANVVLAAKTAAPHAKLPGTIHTAAAEVETAGGHALAVACDIRDEAQVQAAVDAAVARFGGIDICVNNASALALTGTLRTDMRRYDLMNQVNARGTFLCSKLTLPHLLRAANPHILNLSPPLDMQAKWFAGHVAYTMAKYGMSLCTLGMAEEFRAQGVAVNSLWPLTTIDTAAVRFALGGEAMARTSRSADIMADAAHAILTRPSRGCTGNFYIDEEVLRAEGSDRFLALRAGLRRRHADARLLRARRGVQPLADAGSARFSDRQRNAMSEPSDGDRGLLYLDDLSPGQRFTSATHQLDSRQLIAFAAQFDPQPFHLDENAAADTFFGGLAASGWHTAAITMRLLVTSGPAVAGGIVGAGVEVSWPKPTRPNDRLHVESEIIDVAPSRSRPERGTVTMRSETRNQHGDVVQLMIGRLVVPRRVEGKARGFAP